MSTLRHEWTTVSIVLTDDVLRNIADIAGGYTVTRGDGGWLDPNDDLIKEPQATLRVDGISNAHAAIIDGLLLRQARQVGEQSILRTTYALDRMEFLTAFAQAYSRLVRLGVYPQLRAKYRRSV